MTILDHGLPVEAPGRGTPDKLSHHIAREADRVRGLLSACGAVLFRGFSYAPEQDSASVFSALGTQAIPYTERSSPRTEVGHLLYTATDYPARLPIHLHNENSYQQSWPRWLVFSCRKPPDEGGATVLADVQEMVRRLDPGVLKEFRRRDWRLVRTYGHGVGLDWQTAFQTADPDDVGAYCARRGLEYEWLESGALRTSARREATVPHADTGKEIWFNHVMFFHVSTLDASTRSAMLELFGEENLPANSYYGDGERIPDDVVGHIRETYDACSVSHEWTAGDVIVLDNMRLAHGREPYRGNRQLYVMLAGSVSRSAA